MKPGLQSELTKTQLLTSFVFISVFLVFLTAYTKFIFAKEYFFYIEAPCDTETQSCFVRDCDEYCPPNGLDTYSAYYLKASDFPSCTTNDCANICLNEITADKCEMIPCDSLAGDSCSDSNL
jgi:hypothetical protein